MTNQEIVAKLWNLCNVLRDDGITYHQYVTELTYILFLKMAKETDTEDAIPAAYRWDALKDRKGLDLKNYYKELLDRLGTETTGRVREIYAGAATNITEPKNLEKIITSIDELDWFSAKEEGLGGLYEGLLEKNAGEKKSGAGQYFTPRVLIDVMTRLIKPRPGERCNDVFHSVLIQEPLSSPSSQNAIIAERTKYRTSSPGYFHAYNPSVLSEKSLLTKQLCTSLER